VGVEAGQLGPVAGGEDDPLLVDARVDSLGGRDGDDLVDTLAHDPQQVDNRLTA
jgi:hypothetical protein